MRFTRSDRRALLLLFVGIVALWGGVLLDRWLLQPAPGLVTLDEVLMDTLDLAAASSSPSASSSYYAVPVTTPETFPFDPNTADSTTLLRLGLSPWQVRNIYRYRARGGRYHRPEDFQRLYGMTPELWQRLAPKIRISKEFQYYSSIPDGSTPGRPTSDSSRQGGASSRSHEGAVAQLRSSRTDAGGGYSKFTELTPVDLNTADSTLLKRIPGIASYRARQILRYRDRLGGFISIDQLAEIENFPAEELRVWFIVDTAARRPDGMPAVRRLNVNTATVGQLGRHPYIGYARARAIDDYRRLYGTIHSLEELRLLPDFTDEVRRRIEPYVEYLP